MARADLNAWPDRRIGVLRRMWRETNELGQWRWTSTEIAVRLGCSPAAVIAKVHCIGLAARQETRPRKRA